MENEPATFLEKFLGFVSKNIVLEVVVAVVAGLIVAYIAQEGRFAPATLPPTLQSSATISSAEQPIGLDTTISSTEQPVGLDTITSATSVQPPSAGNLLFSEDFDDGFADGFTFQSGNWQVIDDTTGNKVLEMTSTTCCANGLFGPSNISDGIVEFRYKLISANYQAQHHVATFGFRLKIIAGNFTSYSLIYEPDGSNLNLIYQENGGAWLPVERSSGGGSIQTQEGGWVKLRVEFQGENIKVFINDNSFTTAQDSRDKEGALILGANGAVTVQFDDIKVWEFSN